MNNSSININQNKGFSLVEILVSLAVSSIVLVVVGVFISTGTNFFNSTSRTIELQKELMEVSNKVNDSLIQATAINIDYKSSGAPEEGVVIYTGEISTDGKSFITGKGNTSKKIEWTGKTDKKVYVMDSLLLTNDNEKVPYCMGNMVTNIKVSFSDECVRMSEDRSYVLYYEQPLIMEVEITVSDGKESRTDSRIVTLRNEINQLIVDGNSYENDGEVLMKK